MPATPPPARSSSPRAGCARLGVPTPAFPGSGNKGMAELVEDRVWIDAGFRRAPGSLRAFLPTARW